MTVWAQAARTPDKAAQIMAATGRVTTFAQLDTNSLAISHLLKARGLTVGDAVAVYLDNHPAYREIYFGVVRSGMYFVPVNSHLTAAEAAYIVADSGARVVIAGSGAASPVELARQLDGVQLLSVDADLEGYESLEEAVAPYRGLPDPGNVRGLPLYYSSGTTGRPKGIKRPISGAPFEDSSGFEEFLQRQYEIDQDTVYLSPGPDYHAAPLTYAAVTMDAGGTAIIMEKFDAALALDVMERYGVTLSQWVPTMFKRLLSLPDDVRLGHDLSAHRSALLSAAPCPPDLKRAMVDWWGPIITEYYGASETYGMTISTWDDWRSHPASVGRPVLGTPHICDEDGRELPAGTSGAIYFERDEDVFSYHNDPVKTEATRHPLHPYWRKVGDVGYLDEDGYLYLTDRESHVIISGGVNIYPQEVEDALISHPDVADAAVIGVPDDDLGQIVKAVVIPRASDAEGLDRELLDYLSERFARYKLPRSIDLVASLPRLDNGKLYKHKLLEQYSRR